MQPYLFPYLRYLQLMRAADAFVVYDDVNFIKGGWINRNYILSQGGKLLVTLPLQGASPNLLINQLKVGCRPGKLLETSRHCHAIALQFSKVFPTQESIFPRQENLIQNSVELIAD
ncbi:MAG: WbqC family protein [Pseudomonadota bacterium]